MGLVAMNETGIGSAHQAFPNLAGETAWIEFLKVAAGAKLADAFSDGVELAVDLPLSGSGVSLDKKSGENVLGATRPSVLQVVRDMKFPVDETRLSQCSDINEFLDCVSLKVEDASPDSVLSVLFCAARNSGVKIPDSVWAIWEPAVTEWEKTGIVEVAERSWPALAAALAHTVLGNAQFQPNRGGELQYAWARVFAFAVEALQAGYDPRNIPETAVGTHLGLARAALDEERARYERKLFAQQVHQLSLPMVGTDRRRLVDVLFTNETEFTGSMKVFARNDRKNAPLGRGFSVLVLTRPELRKSEPHNWVTISVDTRTGVHLYDLWRELEQMETAAWAKASKDRPRIMHDSRRLQSVPEQDQHYHQQWYLDQDRSLLASPRRQNDPTNPEADLAPGSLLSFPEIEDAMFRVFDPFGSYLVGMAPEKMTHRLPDVEVSRVGEAKKVLSAWWSKDDPLPSPSGPAEWGGLFPTALRAMAARTLGISSKDAVRLAPDLEEFDIIAFGNGLAVVTDGGAFLLDSGRSRPAQIERAAELVRAQATLSEKLDDMQKQVEARARGQATALRGKGSTRSWLDQQRFCAGLHADLIHFRGVLDKPLETDAAGLQPLKYTLSERWNIRARITELATEVEWLQQNSKAAEELRVFRAAKWAGGLALAVVIADALAGRVAPIVQRTVAPLFPQNQIDLAFVEIASFGCIFITTLFALGMGALGLRGRGRNDT